MREEWRLTEALDWMGGRLEAFAQAAADKLGKEAAEIFHAYHMMLQDEGFQQQLFEGVAVQGLSAETAVKQHLGASRSRLGSAPSTYLRQRSADLADIEHGLLDHLANNDPCRMCRDTTGCGIRNCRLGNNHILIGRALTASLPIELDSHTRGFLIEQGSPDSHAVILARALRLPVVGNIRRLSESVTLDTLVLIDGHAGEVILNPAPETLGGLRHTVTGRVRGLPVHTPVPELRVMANIERAADVHRARAAMADGIGLYRTEFEVLAGKRVLGEAEQEEHYRTLVEAMGDRPVTIRLLDLGADKDAGWLGGNARAALARQCRGSRLLLACPELLRTQARALVRAAIYRPIDILYPMVVDLDQFVELKTLFESSVADLHPALLRHGVMFEVPSACLQAEQILEVADFGSIGTNDLVQYLFANDRTCHADPGGHCFEHHAVLWRLVEDLARAARQAGKPLSMCGEIAANPDFTRRIMGAGITTVSAGPAHIAAVRQAAQG